MPTAAINGTQLHYDEMGTGSNTIVFAHGVVFDSRMWEAQMRAFSHDYRCIAYDHRGQGKSAIPRGNSIDHDTLAADAAALIESLEATPCHFVGLSQGGNVGLRLALGRPDLVRSLVVLGTTATRTSDENRRRFRQLALAARLLGPRLVVDRALPIMFGKTFLADPARARDLELWRQRVGTNRRSIYKSINGVADRDSILEQVSSINVPVLVIVGDEDALVPIDNARQLHERIADSRLVIIRSCGHMSNIEQPDEVNRVIADFVASH